MILSKEVLDQRSPGIHSLRIGGNGPRASLPLALPGAPGRSAGREALALAKDPMAT